MLHSEVLDAPTLALLKKLMERPNLAHFNLVGGTALALQIGHRISIDLDLFTLDPFDPDQLIRSFDFPEITENGRNEIYLSLEIEKVKVDFLTYPYKLFEPIVVEDGIRLASIHDIAAMKLSAVASRGVKKDFFDIYFLLREYSLGELVSFFENKYPNVETFHIIKSLTYFDDAEETPHPNMLIPVEWEVVKQTLVEKVREYSLS